MKQKSQKQRCVGFYAGVMCNYGACRYFKETKTYQMVLNKFEILHKKKLSTNVEFVLSKTAVEIEVTTSDYKQSINNQSGNNQGGNDWKENLRNSGKNHLQVWSGLVQCSFLQEGISTTSHPLEKSQIFQMSKWDHWMLKYTEEQSQQIAFTQNPSLSNNPKILTTHLKSHSSL